MLSPFRGRGFYDVQSEVNRAFDEMFGNMARRAGGQQRQAAEWAPAVDVINRVTTYGSQLALGRRSSM